VQRYPVKASLRKGLGLGTLEAAAREHFGTAERAGDRVVARYGAITSMSVAIAPGQLLVELVMDPKVPDEVARDTIGRYNRFLEAATGFSAKERAKRLRKGPDA
jgi:hypothetical protein